MRFYENHKTIVDNVEQVISQYSVPNILKRYLEYGFRISKEIIYDYMQTYSVRNLEIICEHQKDIVEYIVMNDKHKYERYKIFHDKYNQQKLDILSKILTRDIAKKIALM